MIINASSKIIVLFNNDLTIIDSNTSESVMQLTERWSIYVTTWRDEWITTYC